MPSLGKSRLEARDKNFAGAAKGIAKKIREKLSQLPFAIESQGNG
jgi:hypothetical protein